MMSILTFAIGYLAALFWFWRGAKKEGFPENLIFDLFFFATLGFFLLGRFSYLLAHEIAVFPNIFFVWRGVLPAWGIFAVIFLFWDFINRRRLSFYRISDYFISSISLFLAIYLLSNGEILYAILFGIAFGASVHLLAKKIYAWSTVLTAFVGGTALYFALPSWEKVLIWGLDLNFGLAFFLIGYSLLGLISFMIKKR